MKLIDLDEIEYFTLVDKDGIPRYRIEIGDGLPIVKAIPMGWIRAYTRSTISNADYWAIIRMVTKWEKENENIKESD